jgi:hypothetical protein
MFFRHLVLPTNGKANAGVCIIDISSVAGLRFTEATAIVYAKRGVRLETVIPAQINTLLVKIMADK